MAGCWLYRKLFSPFRVLLFFISFLFLYFLPCTLLVIVLCCMGYIYIYLEGIDPSSKIYTGTTHWHRRREVLCCWLHGCCCAKDIYIYYIHTKVCFLYYIIWPEREEKKKWRRRKKNWKSITQSRPFSCLFLYIILSVFRSADI